MNPVRLARVIASALLLACSSAHAVDAVEYEILPRCWWPSPVPLPVCLLEEPEVVNCKKEPYDPMCEDYPGAVKAVTAKVQRLASCKTEFEITFRDLNGERKKSLKTRAIDCVTHEPITSP
ncbi:hypothetical protein WJ96_05330 [Burkholderia ubonensis]|uniref:Secreted protein n=1 Tax=Burkholderia ubonensis TaxID=101571 RepID=A0AAW3MVZ4_9BURK|nr:hypothetical protein [Burkholderia ubonensis]KVP75180.1 hypothetical protein WJ93_07120 [Burkholderia ubonensis]KVP96648.1 hypothetical protein WJ97_12250 [Burkholderia ubonensis]KVP97994.1 hypothetical protein WJ96_05330 [Burkholderia ubonensis]KVZ92692.1 hypothetical protein WL25_16990 [Burkholderia ubonensis]